MPTTGARGERWAVGGRAERGFERRATCFGFGFSTFFRGFGGGLRSFGGACAFGGGSRSTLNTV